MIPSLASENAQRGQPKKYFFFEKLFIHRQKAHGQIPRNVLCDNHNLQFNVMWITFTKCSFYLSVCAFLRSERRKYIDFFVAETRLHYDLLHIAILRFTPQSKKKCVIFKLSKYKLTGINRRIHALCLRHLITKTRNVKTNWKLDRMEISRIFQTICHPIFPYLTLEWGQRFAAWLMRSPLHLPYGEGFSNSTCFHWNANTYELPQPCLQFCFSSHITLDCKSTPAERCKDQAISDKETENFLCVSWNTGADWRRFLTFRPT